MDTIPTFYSIAYVVSHLLFWDTCTHAHTQTSFSISQLAHENRCKVKLLCAFFILDPHIGCK